MRKLTRLVLFAIVISFACARRATAAVCISILSPPANSTVSGVVALPTNDVCSGVWFEAIKVDGVFKGTAVTGKVTYDTTALASGPHTFTINSQSANPGSTTLGSASVVLNVSSARTMGQWSPTYPWPSVGIHLILLPNGKALTWDDPPRYPDGPFALSFVVDLPSGQPPGASLYVPNTRIDLFCDGHTLLPDGRTMAIGGTDYYDFLGYKNTEIFDFRDNSWSPGPFMSGGRWYGTLLTLASGEVLALSGSFDLNHTPYPIPDVSTGGATGFRALTSASLALPLYPRIHLAPNGKVFLSGPQGSSRYLDTAGTGAWSTSAHSSYSYRSYGTSVMYDTGKVLILGGVSDETIPPTASAEVIDLTAATPAWRNVAPMAFGRRHVNATLLPDGKVLITGGTSSPGPDDATGLSGIM